MPIKLDLTDKKLLFELDMNARISNSKLAKKLNISKQSVQYRINKLQRDEVIKGFYTVIDLSKMNCMYVRFFIRFKDVTPKIEKEIINYFLQNSDYRWIVSIDGIWDLATALILKDFISISNVTNRFLSKYGEYVDNYELNVATQIDHMQNRFLLEEKHPKEIIIGGKLEDNQLDALDRNILSILSQDARKKLTLIASELNISYKVISYRINSMIKKGIIKCFRVDLNYNKLGYIHYKVFINLKKFNSEKILALKSFIKLNPNTIYITYSVASTELEFEVVFDKYAKLHDFLQDLRSKFTDTIKSYYYIILYKFYEINYFPSGSVSDEEKIK